MKRIIPSLLVLLCFFWSVFHFYEIGLCEEPNSKPAAEPAVAQSSIEGLSKAGKQAGERIVITVNDVEIAFRWCPPGTFMMGSPESEEERGYDEAQHKVTFTKGFWIMETEVTVGMFKAFVNETGYLSQGTDPLCFHGELFGGWYHDLSLSWNNPGYSQDDNCPVTCVSWDDSAAFCKWLGAKTGLKILLPTEAQWEYACRAGSSTAFFWGNALNGDKANCDGNFPYGTKEKGKFLEKAMPVRSYSPNAWGLYDMHGNVWERCSDWYDSDFSEDVTDPTGPEMGIYTVNRGGGWNRKAEYSRSSYRDKDEPEFRINNLGFRCTAVLQTKNVAESAAKEDENQETVSHKAGERTVDTVNGVKFAFRWCPEGDFIMGANDSFKSERAHKVTLTKGFWMMETEVTVAMFKAFVKDTGYVSPANETSSDDEEDVKRTWLEPGFSQNDQHPVTCVSWDDAVAFCKWLSKKTGKNIKLPTEAQWEYACRAGSSTDYFWGNALNGDKANCDGAYPEGTKEKGPYLEKTTPVASYSPNAWGLYDMHGNVSEWCADWFGEFYFRGDPYLRGSVVDPIGPLTGYLRVTRGGAWDFSASACRSASRRQVDPQDKFNSVGFRCAVVSQTDDEAVANNKPSANKPGKLYVLSVWGTNASDLHEALESLQNTFAFVMNAGGLNLNSRSDPDEFVKEFISLSGDQASKKNVLETCRSIGQRAQKNDVIFVYMCCHGVTKRLDGDNKRYHVLFPGIKSVDQMQNVKEYGILRTEILEALSPENHRLVVFITDAGTRDQDEQIIKLPEESNIMVCYDPAYLRRPFVEENPLRIFLKTNTGVVDWNSTSPFGGKDGQGEQSPYYRIAHLYEGVFAVDFMLLTLENKKAVSKSKLFEDLKTLVADSYKFRSTYVDSSEASSILTPKNNNQIFSNQPSLTLFDFEGRGYVVDKADSEDAVEKK